uniref:Guanine nucleotide-binding protein subunit gamma n=1 Tax=Ditylenchus dipsaci TaxID=166011 RepID=A0A915EIJ8_9BILA
MEQARMTTEQLRIEANLPRKKVSEAAKDLIEYCEEQGKKTQDFLITGPADQNPFQEKSLVLLVNGANRPQGEKKNKPQLKEKTENSNNFDKPEPSMEVTQESEENKGPIVEPTRPVDLWNPFGTTTTRRPGLDQRKKEIIVRLSIGDIVGQKIVIPDLPWTANQDPLEAVPDTRSHQEPNPLPNKNDIVVFTFLGVPYAEPPISQRRLKPPQLLVQLPGDSPFIAFDMPPSCAQDIETRPTLFVNEPYAYRVSEDCLYLNVFTPDASKSSGNVYPVMVFLHGGNFQTGTANDWPGHVLASRGIVVVTVNYRLGPLGFMSLGDQETGNFGIQDQRMALSWVQQHIASFGGDPQAVTIVGHDAGAVSAGIHMLSPYSRNMFRGVAAMSGAEVSYHSIIGKPALAFNNTMKLGRYLGCVQPVAQHVWDCILTRSTNDIIQAVSPTSVPAIPIEYNRYLFMPTVDGRELTSHPLWLLNNAPTGLANIPSSVPYLTGLNQEDGVEVILEDRTLGEFTDFLQVTHSYMHSFIVEYAFMNSITDSLDPSERGSASKRKRNPIWENFTPDEDDEGKKLVRCNQCQKKLTSSKTVLDRHWIKFHSDKPQTAKKILANTALDHSKDKRYDTIQKTIAQVLTIPSLPINVLLHPFMQKLFHVLNSAYELPTSFASLKNILLQKNDQVQRKLSKVLQTLIPRCSLTCDIWTDGGIKHAYLGVTVHGCDRFGKLRRFFLGFANFVTLILATSYDWKQKSC